jgi:cytochrome P450
MATALLPPTYRPRFPGATIVDFRGDPLGFLAKLARDYGDLATFRVGPQRFLFVNDPGYIKEILVTRQANFVKSRALQRARCFLGDGLLTAEGAAHRRQRRLAQPAFHRERVAGYGAAMVEAAVTARERWHAGDHIDASREMMRLTLEIVARTLFGAEVASEADDIERALTTVMNGFNRLLLPFSEYFDALPLPGNRRRQAAAARLDATVYRMIAERRASGEERDDLLSLLLRARDDEGDGTGMSDKQLRDEALTIFLAGHETTANALTWTWYLLSQNPEAARRMYDEIRTALGGRLATVADLPKLPYTEAVLAEGLRLYPPAWAVGRQALEAFTLGDYEIPAGTMILMSQWVMHRDSRFYPDPERFDPDRWTPERRAERPKFAYFPFGGGARVCIGEQFALMEGVLLLATIAGRGRLELTPGARPVPQPLMTLRPRYGMPMIVHEADSQG